MKPTVPNFHQFAVERFDGAVASITEEVRDIKLSNDNDWSMKFPPPQVFPGEVYDRHRQSPSTTSTLYEKDDYGGKALNDPFPHEMMCDRQTTERMVDPGSRRSSGDWDLCSVSGFLTGNVEGRRDIQGSPLVKLTEL